MGMEKLAPATKFDIRIEKLNDNNLDRYKNFLLGLILGKHGSETRRLAILDRVNAVSKEVEIRKLTNNHLGTE